MHEGGGRWVGSNKVAELKKKKKNSLSNTMLKGTSFQNGARTTEYAKEKAIIFQPLPSYHMKELT